MKLNKSDKYKHYEGKEQIQMGLDLENTHSIMSLLRNNIYSDPITSWVREIYSNAVDAHARVNNTEDAIDINIKQQDGGYVFIVRDYGPSMNKDTIANVYAKMGKSDKRSGNNEMGGWGLGAKSPLAYTDHFWIETWTVEDNTNVYRKWVQYIDSSRVGALSLLEEEEWQQGKTGTKVTIPFDSKDHSAVTNALQYYLSYTDAKYNLLEDTSDNLDIARKWYTYYGSNWALNLKEENGSHWLSEKNEGVAIVGDIPYDIDCKVLFNYFKNNLQELLPIADNLKPYYIKDDKHNRTLYVAYLNSIVYHAFEIKLDIGSVDLSASREDLQYTDRTCGHLFKVLYQMFLDVYQFVRMDLVNHPNYPEACIIFANKYEGGFKKHFLDKVRWAKEDLAFGSNPPIFKRSNSKDFCTYHLDTVYTKNNKTKDVLKKSEITKLYTGSTKYEIVIQDTEYSNFSKFVKYYAQSKGDSKFNYTYLCIDPFDLENVYEWILETTDTIKLSNLVADFKENAPVTSGNRASEGTFKVLTYRYHTYRPRANGIGSYFDYEEVDINPNEEKYYISKEEWENLPEHLKGMSDGCYYATNINKILDRYLSIKGIRRRSLVFTPKVTRNFKHDNWINFVDLLNDDYKKFSKKEEEISLGLFNATYTERQMPEFIKINSELIERSDSKFLDLKKFYDKYVEYLNDNKEAVTFLSLINSSVRDLLSHREGSYFNYTVDNLDFMGDYKERAKSILSMYEDYVALLPFLRTYKDYRLVDNYDIRDQHFAEYINLMEGKYNLYVEESKEKEEPQEITQEVSEYKTLQDTLVKRYSLV